MKTNMTGLLITILSIILTLLPAGAVLRAGIGPIKKISPVAFVIGNGNYQQLPSDPGAARDAEATAATFEKLGFQVSRYREVTGEKLKGCLDQMQKEAAGSKLCVFYYAGRAFSSDGRNFLAAVDCNALTKGAALQGAVDIQDVFAAMDKAGADRNVCFFDTGFPPVEGVSKGSSRATLNISSPKNTLALFAAGPGQESLVGHPGLSPLTEALTQALALKPNQAVELKQLCIGVARQVKKATNEKQTPWLMMDASMDEYQLAPGSQPQVAPSKPIKKKKAE